jgi:flagellar biosynthesis/type III secretory pathway chaperone
MINQSDIKDLQKLVTNFGRLYDSYDKAPDIESIYQQWLTEAVDVLTDIFGERNNYVLNIVNKSDAPFAFNLDGSVSRRVIKDILAILKASLSSAERKMGKKPEAASINDPYVDLSRIEELESLASNKFDLCKIVAICKELNHARSNNSYLSIALLTRSLIDHVPPIFDLKNFNEVVNNYGNRSFRESMNHLNNSSRKIADSYLHTQIRRNESLPTFIQVNFSSDIDVLLSEIIRLLK